MKSITIHNMDDALAERLVEEARRRKKSINRTIKEILKRALQVSESESSNPTKKGYRRFLGLWTLEDQVVFHMAIEEFETVNPADWREGL